MGLAACGSSSLPGAGASAVTGKALTCNEAFKSTLENANAASARLGPINWDGPETLILSFATPEARDAAAGRLRTTPPAGVEVARLHVFRHLAMLTVPTATATPEVIEGLRAALDGLPLISIWGNLPLRYVMETSRPVIGAEIANEALGLTGRGIGVAIIDSGIDETQGDFANVVYNAKFVNEIGFVETDNSDLTTGHGTHVAGTVAGTGASSGGRFKGVAPDASLIGLNIEEPLFFVNPLNAFDQLADPEFRQRFNIRVTNNSYGPFLLPGEDAPDFNPAEPIQLASKALYDAGVINVFAAGNDGPRVRTLSPYAASPCNIGAGAANREGGLASFSSRGRPDDPFYSVDISAPGALITAPRSVTGAVATTVPRPDFPLYSTISGTSMATPHVAGAVAVLLEGNPTLSLEQVQQIIRETAVPMRADQPLADAPQVGKDYAPWEAGPGMLNLAGAAARVLSQPTPPLRVGRTGLSPGGGETLLGRWTGQAGFIVGAVEPVPTVRFNPCLCGIFDRHYVVDLPPVGAYTELKVRLVYENPEEIWRIRLFGPEPDGALLADVNSQLSGATELVLSFPDPQPGTYRAMVSEYETQGSPIEVAVSVVRP